MKLLALESSSERCSVCLFHDGALACRQGDGARNHSDLMLPFVHDIFAQAGCTLADLDCIACGVGPGGFTGLRLACGVAQGLALAGDLPLIGVGSLEALALGRGDRDVYVCVDARMNEVYCAAYRVVGDGVDTVIAPTVVAPAAVPLPPGNDWLGCGNGFGSYPELLKLRLGARLAAVDATALPEAGSVARLAARRWAQGERPNPEALAPAYVRDKVALTVAERSRRPAATP